MPKKLNSSAEFIGAGPLKIHQKSSRKNSSLIFTLGNSIETDGKDKLIYLGRNGRTGWHSEQANPPGLGNLLYGSEFCLITLEQVEQ